MRDDRPRLTTAAATVMVERIEDLQAKIDAIYADVDMNFSGHGNSGAICEVVKARKDLREADFSAGAILSSFDAED